MAAAAGRADDFVKDYLIFRGLSTTLRTLETELKNEKEKGFRADKMVDQLQAYITNYDLPNLREYWNFLNTRLFARLEQRYMSSVRKLEVGLLKYYLVHASVNNKQDKILDFFERMTELLQTQAEFKDWFAFAFVRNPEENPNFQMYFTKHWQETYFLSLHNFLSVILQSMPVPVLLNFEADYWRLKQYQEENQRLKQQLLILGEKPDLEARSHFRERDHTEHNSMELIYDFSSLGEDTAIPETEQKSPKKFSFPSSPLNIGKKTDKSSVKKKEPGKDDALKMLTISKDVRAKTSKLLPVITRQRRVKPVQVVQSHSVDAPSTNHHTLSEMITNQKIAEAVSANQRMRKMEEAKGERKELLDKADDGGMKYNRSVSEPATEMARPWKKDADSKRGYSKSVLESKRSEKSPAVSEPTASTMKPTGHTETPAISLVTMATEEASSSSAAGTSQKTTDVKSLDSISEKPFILLSQEEYCEHRSAVSYARFSMSGQLVASVDVDGVVKVWSWGPEPTTAATVMSKSAFLSLEWASKSDRWLLLGNRSGNIRLFDVREMKSFYEATGDTSYPRVICLCSNPASASFVCSSTAGRVRSGSIGADTSHVLGDKLGKLTIWDLKTMKADKPLPLHPGPVAINCCAFNHNGQLLVCGGVDGAIRLFDVQQQKCISQWEAHKGEIRSVQFSSDYNSCYSLGADEKLTEWSIHKANHRLQDFPIHQGAAANFLSAEPIGNKEVPRGNLIALDSDGQYLLSCNDMNALIYKLIKEEPGLAHIMELKGQRSSPITTVDWSPNIDTKICLTGSMDGKIKVSTLLSQ